MEQTPPRGTYDPVLIDLVTRGGLGPANSALFVDSKGLIQMAFMPVIVRNRQEVESDVAEYLLDRLGCKRRDAKQLAKDIVLIIEDFGYPFSDS